MPAPSTRRCRKCERSARGGCQPAPQPPPLERAPARRPRARPPRPGSLCLASRRRMGETNEYFTDWNETYESFDQMQLHENLLRGIYAYGARLRGCLLQRCLCPASCCCMCIAGCAGVPVLPAPAAVGSWRSERWSTAAWSAESRGTGRSGTLGAGSRRWRCGSSSSGGSGVVRPTARRWSTAAADRALGARPASRRSRRAPHAVPARSAARRPPPSAPTPVRAAGFEKPSAIQQKGIVPFGKGLDVIQQAQSGTGKTATFCAGVLQVRRRRPAHHARRLQRRPAGIEQRLPAAAACERLQRAAAWGRWSAPLRLKCADGRATAAARPRSHQSPALNHPPSLSTEPGLLPGGVPGAGAGAHP